MMRRLLSFGILGFFVLISISCTSKGLKDAKRYYSAQNGVSILFPLAWEVHQGYMNTALSAVSPLEGGSDRFQDNVTVVAQEFPDKIDLNQKFEQTVDSIASGVMDFAKQEDGRARLGGVTSRWVIYSFPISGLNIKTLMYLFVKDKRFYIITCTSEVKSFGKYHETFIKIAESVKFFRAK